MKVEVPKEKLLHALGLVEKVSSKHVTLPVLQCVLFSAKDTTLTLRATNLDVGIEYALSAKIDREGVVAVPATIISQAAAASFGEALALEHTDEGLMISDARSSTTIRIFDADEFPTLPRVEQGTTFTAPADKLVEGFKSVWYAASNSTIKPELASVYLYHHQGDLVFVATDSFRLAEKRIALTQAISMDEAVLLPIRNTTDIVRALADAPSEVTVTFTENQIAFSFEGVYLTSRLIDGAFPDYQQIIPNEFSTTITALKQDALAVLRKATIFSDKFNQITFSIEGRKRKVSVRSRNPEVGESVDTLPSTIEGEDLEISFNHRFITDCFQSIASDSVTFSFSGLGRPMVLTGVSDATFRYLVMPMNK